MTSIQHLQLPYPVNSVGGSTKKHQFPLESEQQQHLDPLVLEQPGTEEPMDAFCQQLVEKMVQQQQMFSELHQSADQEKHRKEKDQEQRHRHELQIREDERKRTENLQKEREERQQLEQQRNQSFTSLSSVDLPPHERLNFSTATANPDTTQPLHLFLGEIDNRLDAAKRPMPMKPKSKTIEELKGPLKVVRQNFNCFDCRRELKGKCANCRIKLLQCIITQQKKELIFERNLRVRSESEVLSLKRKRQEDKKKRNTSSKRICRLKGYALVIIEFRFVK